MGGGAVPRVDPVTVTPGEVSTKTATRRQESVAARYIHMHTGIFGHQDFSEALLFSTHVFG